MINWLLGLDDLNEKIQKEYVHNLKNFLIKEDFNYLQIFLKELNLFSDDLDKIKQIYFWDKFFIWYQTRTFNYKLNQLIDELKGTKVLFKKCLLCECEIETLTSTWSTKLTSLNSSRLRLYKDLVNYFKTLRSNCELINDNYKEFNFKLLSDNQISKLPIETFDNILEVDEFNYVKLKSLVQLIKLEISEFLTLIIFFYSIDKSDFYTNLKNLSFFIGKLIVEIRKFNQKINEDCSYFVQFFIKNADDNTPFNADINPKQKEILLNLKSAKAKICSSLLMIDNCLSSILDESFNETNPLDNEKIINELSSAIDILKLVSTESKKNLQFNSKSEEKSNNPDQVNSVVAKEVCLNNQIPEYEVFEAYVTEDEQIERFIEKYEEEHRLSKPDFPNSLYGELKEVLAVKAKDHRAREAKALGINEEDLLKEQLETKVEKRPRFKQNDNLSLDPLPQISFNLIKLTAEKNKKINFLSNGENFGDDLSSDE